MYTLNITNPMKVNDIICKLKQEISTVVIISCGSYMFEFSVSKEMKKKINNDKKRIPSYLLAYLLTLIVKKKISAEQGRVVTTLNIIKH